MTKIIDLTMKIYEGMPHNPDHGRFPVVMSGTQTHEGWKRAGIANPYDPCDLVSFQNEHLAISGHTGTHMDACFHANPYTHDGIDQMPIERGMGQAIWLDVSRCFKSGAKITAKDLKQAEEQSGAKIGPEDIVLIHTGWDTMQKDPSWATQYIGLCRDAGEWLREKKVKTVGIDSINLDACDGKDLPVHMNFLRPQSIGLDKNDFIAIIENLQGINKIAKPRFTFSGLPLPIVGGTGSPIRAVAMIK